MANNNSFWKDGFSIDETRVSILVITYITGFAAALVLAIINKDIESLKAMFFANVTAITGINITNAIANSRSVIQNTAEDESGDSESKG